MCDSNLWEIARGITQEPELSEQTQTTAHEIHFEKFKSQQTTDGSRKKTKQNEKICYGLRRAICMNWFW